MDDDPIAHGRNFVLHISDDTDREGMKSLPGAGYE
jgi:hypothetical protein